MPRRLAPLLFSLSFAGLPAEAEESRAGEESVELPAMQVTAGRRSAVQFMEPPAVTVITAADISEKAPQVMTQALAYEPGAFFQQSGPGQGIVIVRGLKGSEVLHLVDGMRLNNSFFRNSPSQYIALVDPENVERLELLRGPYATVYGSDAMGGVFQVVTPEERFESDGWSWRGAARAHYGSADLARTGRASLAGGSAGFSVAAGFSFSEFGERRLPQPGQSPDGAGGITSEQRVNDTAYLSRGWDAKVLWNGVAHELMASTQAFEIPELQRYFQTVPGYGSSIPRQIAEFRNRREFHHLRYRYRLAIGPVEQVEVHLARQDMTDDRLDRNNPASPPARDEFTFNRSVMDGFTVQAETALAANRLRYGLDAYRDTVSSSAYRESPPGSGTFTYPNGTSFFSPFPDGSRATELGAWVLDEWSASEALRLEGGLRYTRVDTEVARGDRARGFDLRHDEFSGSLGARLALTERLAWTANAGKGFRAPNLFDLAVVGQRAGTNPPDSTRRIIANLELQPESVVTLDSGLRFAGPGLTADAVLFVSDYRDRIATVNNVAVEGTTPECANDFDATTTTCSQNRNIAGSRYYGFEGGVRAALAPGLRLRATLNYTRGEQEAGGVKTPANRVPPLNGQVAAEIALSERWSLEPWLFWADRQTRLDPNDLTDSRINPSGTGGYAVSNLRSIWTAGPSFRLIGELRNLADKAYREHGSGIDGPGRGIAATAEYRFR